MTGRTTNSPWAMWCAILAAGFGCTDAPQDARASNPPIVLPLFTLQDHAGESFGTAQMRDRVSVINFTQTQCDSGCVNSMPVMRQLQDRLAMDEPLAADLLLVSIALDLDTETPGTLVDHARRAGADTGIWKFLTGPRDQIQRLAAGTFQLPADKAVVNDGRVFVVGRRGRIQAAVDGLSPDAADLLLAQIEILTAERLEYAPGPYPGIDTSGAGFFARPLETFDPPWLAGMQAAQLQTIDEFEVFHDFRFSDEAGNSGITFRHKVTDDGAIAMKPVHYDHGNGIPIADVDGDGLYDIYFVNQVGGNELWRNLGGGRFENITKKAGIALPDPISITGSFADIDNDGDPDLYVTTVRAGNRLYENNGKGKFKDISAKSGLDHSGHSSTPVFFDYDRDGLLDVFLTNVGKYTGEELRPITPLFPEFKDDSRYKYWVGYVDAFSGHLKPERDERSLLFRNQGKNRFKDVTEEVKLYDISWTGDASPIDFNDDGWTDLYVTNMQGHDELYENIEGKEFRYNGRTVFPKTPWGSMGIKAFDYNNDGHMDIYITDMHSDMMEDIPPEREKLRANKMWPEDILQSDGKSLFGNALFENQGDGTFEEVTQQTNAENYWPWGLSTGDLNADGWEDVFIASSMSLPYRYGVNSLLLNNRGKRFLDSEFILGIEPRPGETEMPWYEVECPEPETGAEPAQKGWGDNFINTVCEDQTGRVIVWAAKGTRTSVIFDVDDDGDLDIVTSEFNSTPRVLISDLAQSKPSIRYLKLRLVGKQSNRDGLGARVKVRTADGSFTKVHDGKTGYLTQSSHPLYFGLGDAGTIEQIEIEWPSGRLQILNGPIEANRLLVIEEQ